MLTTSKVSKVAKVVVCGMKGVGKTAILEQLIYGNVMPDTEIDATIEDTYVASIDTSRGVRDTLRLFDTAGLQGSIQLPRHYFYFAEGYVLVYDPRDGHSFEILEGIKSDIDRHKEKKEVTIIVIANQRESPAGSMPEDETIALDRMETLFNRVSSWCTRERIKHYTVNALERASLYNPFIGLAIRLHPPPAKSGLTQLRQLTQKTPKPDLN